MKFVRRKQIEKTLIEAERLLTYRDIEYFGMYVGMLTALGCTRLISKQRYDKLTERAKEILFQKTKEN